MSVAENSWLALDSADLAYGSRPILRGLSIALDQSRPSLTLVGASGTGKSSLLALLAGHLRPRAGRVTLFEKEVTGPSPVHPLVFQDYALFPWKCVLDNVAFGLKCAGLGRAEREARASTLLANLGLAGTERLWPHQLSGGMRQRVGLARVLVLEPRCLLLDEPFSAVDEFARGGLQRLVLQTYQAARLSHWVVATHDLAEAVLLGSMLLVLRPDGTALTLDNPGWPHAAHDVPELASQPAAMATLRALRGALTSGKAHDNGDWLVKTPLQERS
jgi:NitT/TauT family transport system ATP-binding protein